MAAYPHQMLLHPPCEVVCSKAGLIQVGLSWADPEHELASVIGGQVYLEIYCATLSVGGLDWRDKRRKVCHHALVVIATNPCKE